MYKTSASGLGFQHLHRYLANVNAWKTMLDPYMVSKLCVLWEGIVQMINWILTNFRLSKLSYTIYWKFRVEFYFRYVRLCYFNIHRENEPVHDKTNHPSRRCPHDGPWSPTKSTAKTLIRQGGCQGWSESSLGAHVILLVLSWLKWYLQTVETLCRHCILRRLICVCTVCRLPFWGTVE